MGFNLSIFWVSLVAVIAAEIGCLARTVVLISRYGSPLSVCAGTLVGNVLLIIPALLGGEWLHRHLSADYTRIACGLILVLIGLVAIFYGK